MFFHILRVAYQVGLGKLKPRALKQGLTVEFRCWPTDLDYYFHMNNASYFKTAEMTRWRLFAQTPNALERLMKFNTLFYLVESNVVYHKQILPFQKYVIRTKITTKDDKWLFYTHTFEQHPCDMKGSDPIKFAEIVSRAVVKEKSGKTIKPDNLDEYIPKE